MSGCPCCEETPYAIQNLRNQGRGTYAGIPCIVIGTSYLIFLNHSAVAAYGEMAVPMPYTAKSEYGAVACPAYPRGLSDFPGKLFLYL